MGIMPEVIMHTIRKSESKSCIIGKSPRGTPVVIFKNTDQARKWREKSPNHSIRFFHQETITEEIELDI